MRLELTPRYVSYTITLIIGPILFLLCACSTTVDTTEPTTVNSNKLVRIVSTSNIVADWVENIGQNHVSISSLYPQEIDPHTYMPGPQDAAKIADAHLIFIIGANFENLSLQKLLNNASMNRETTSTTRVVDLSESVDLLAYGEYRAGHANQHDPHYWLDPIIVETLIRQISSALIDSDPSHKAEYAANAGNYIVELRRLHTWISDRVKKIPDDKSVLITTHDSLQYFANRYGFQVLGTVIPEVTTEKEITPLNVKEIINKIEKYDTPAIFGDINENNKVAEMISNETDVLFIQNLHIGSLGSPGTETQTYVDLMKTNVKHIVEGLK